MTIMPEAVAVLAPDDLSRAHRRSHGSALERPPRPATQRPGAAGHPRSRSARSSSRRATPRSASSMSRRARRSARPRSIVTGARSRRSPRTSSHELASPHISVPGRRRHVERAALDGPERDARGHRDRLRPRHPRAALGDRVGPDARGPVPRHRRPGATRRGRARPRSRRSTAATCAPTSTRISRPSCSSGRSTSGSIFGGSLDRDFAERVVGARCCRGSRPGPDVRAARAAR